MTTDYFYILLLEFNISVSRFPLMRHFLHDDREGKSQFCQQLYFHFSEMHGKFNFPNAFEEHFFEL